ncbi:unnamed protein product [Leuciscus chuanchicus]
MFGTPVCTCSKLLQTHGKASTHSQYHKAKHTGKYSQSTSRRIASLRNPSIPFLQLSSKDVRPRGKLCPARTDVLKMKSRENMGCPVVMLLASKQSRQLTGTPPTAVADCSEAERGQTQQDTSPRGQGVENSA